MNLENQIELLLIHKHQTSERKRQDYGKSYERQNFQIAMTLVLEIKPEGSKLSITKLQTNAVFVVWRGATV